MEKNNYVFLDKTGHSESSKGGQELLYALPSSSVIPPCESSIVCPLTYLDSLAGRFGGRRAALAVQFLWNVWNAQLESQRRLRRRRRQRLAQRLRRRQLASAAAPAVCLWLASRKLPYIHPQASYSREAWHWQGFIWSRV